MNSSELFLKVFATVVHVCVCVPMYITDCTCVVLYRKLLSPLSLQILDSLLSVILPAESYKGIQCTNYLKKYLCTARMYKINLLKYQSKKIMNTIKQHTKSSSPTWVPCPILREFVRVPQVVFVLTECI